MIHFVTNRAGTFTMRDFVDIHAPGLAPYVDIIHYEDLPERATVSSGTYIFAALDQLTPGGMALVRELATQLEAPSAQSRVLNHPARVLLRYELLKTLHGEALNRHGAAPATTATTDLTFPVFIREESQHNGSLTPLLATHAALQKALGKAVLQGYRLSDLLIVEYCETADSAGRYRRYAAFKVGTQVIARELMFGTDWMLKSDGNAPNEPDIMEERAFVLGNEHADAVHRIFELACVDYGRVDYAVCDGVIETWEINLNPTIRRGRERDPVPIPDALSRLRDPAREHFTNAFQAALRAEDLPGPSHAVAVRYSDACVRGATPMVRSDGGTWLRPLASAVRPAIPKLRRIIDAVSPLVARMAQRLTQL